MKKFIISLTTALFCILTIGCITVNAQTTIKTSGKVIKASGVAAEEIRNIKGFTKVTTSSSIDVYLKQSGKFTVTVHADKNVIDYVRTELKGDRLYVGYEEKRGLTITNMRGVRTRVYITLPVIESLTSGSSGDIHVESNIEAKSLSLSASSSGDIEFLNINCINLDARASSSGDIEGGLVKCKEELTVRASSSGDVKIGAVTPYCKINASSSGDVEIKGQGDYCIASASSSGDIMLYDFVCREVKATSSSSGSIYINVTEKLTAKASSGGDVFYKGNPREIDRTVSSGGSIKQR